MYGMFHTVRLTGGLCFQYRKCLILCYIHRLIYEKFSSADVNKKENSVGIQLMGIVLANKISPFRPGCGVDIER